MAPDALVALLRDLLGRLLNEPTVEVTAKTIGRPTDRATLRRVSGRVPEHLQAVYAQTEGFKVAWRIKDCSRSYRDGNGGCIWLPTLTQNARGFETGFEVAGGELVQLVEATAHVNGLQRCAVTLAGEGVVIFDGNYQCGTFPTAADCLAAAIACVGIARWIDLYVDGADAGPVRAAVNENRARLGLAPL